MTSATFSIKAFGVGAVVGGLPVVLTPDVVLGILQMPRADGPWVRLWAMEVVVLGFYYLAAGRAELRAFFVASVWGRLGFSAALVGLVVLTSAPWQVLIVGALDSLGATWTWLGLHGGTGSTPTSADWVK